MFNSLHPHGLQHVRLPCPSLSPVACSNSCSLSRWCHPTISSFVLPFSSCPQTFSASESFYESALHIRWPKYWSFSFNINPSNEHPGPSNEHPPLPMNTQSQESSLEIEEASILQPSAFFIVQLSHPYMTTRKTIALTWWTFVGKVMSLLFNMLSRLVIIYICMYIYIYMYAYIILKYLI